MKTQTIACALIALAAIGTGNAFADEGNFKAEPAFVSTLSRVAVQAEAAKAQTQGTLQTAGDADREPAIVSTASRAQVREEAVQSVHNNSVVIELLGS